MSPGEPAAGQGPEERGPFLTLAAPHEHREVVQNSEFLAFAERAQTPAQAQAALAGLRARFPDATHHCWAYQIGALYRFSDDGEPGGTAGAPILRAIQGQGLDEVVVVVVRFYGGVKLGAGGLVRAYGGAAAECLRLAPRLEVRPRHTWRAHVPFEHLGAFYHLLTRFDAGRGPEGYGAAGAEFELSLLVSDEEPFASALRDATRGAAELVRVHSGQSGAPHPGSEGTDPSAATTHKD